MRNLRCFLVLTLVFVLVGFSFNGALTDASESKLIFDDPELSTFKAETYHLEGELPIGNTVEVDGEKAEVFRKFRITIPLDKPETYTPVEIVVKDEAGNELENYTHHIENRGEINLKLVLRDPTIEINGEKFPLEVPMHIIRGSAMVPLRDVAMALRAKVSNHPQKEFMTITNGSTIITIAAGEEFAMVGSEKIRLTAPAEVVEDTLLVPFRFIAEAFGAEVVWHGDDRSVTIRMEFGADVNFEKSTLNGSNNLILDDPEPSVLLGTEYMIEGEIPMGATVTVDGVDAEIFHKFRTEVKLEEHPSYTRVKLEVFDSKGKKVESRKIAIENVGELTMWLQQNNPTWMVNYINDTLSVPPTNVGGSMLLPFRAIAEAFGAEVEWIAATRTVRMTLHETTGKTSLDLTIDSKIAVLNGIEVELTTAATIINGSTLVPLRFVGEAFGAEVIWNSDDRSVDIKKWIYPEKLKDEPKEVIEDEFTLAYDDPTFTTYKAETYHLEGTIPAGHTLNANYVEAEIFQKFKTSVVLNDAPSFTPAIIEITDKDGNELESYTLNIENYKEKTVKLVMMDDSMKVDGEEVEISVGAMIVSGSFMIPIKDVAEALDGEFSWDEESQTATIFTKSKLTELKVGDDFVTINEEKVSIGAEIISFSDTIFVPFRLVESAFTDTKVSWNLIEKTAIITRQYHPNPTQTDSKLNDEKNLILDDLNSSVANGKTYKLEGEIPMGAAVKINGIEAETSNKFRAEILVDSHPSENPVIIAVYNEEGNLAFSEEIVIFNKTLYLKIWKNNPEIFLNGGTFDLGCNPIIISECMMVPTLLISDFLDAEPDWDGQTRTFTMEKDDITIELPVDSDIMRVNGVEKKMKTKTQIIEGRAMSPINHIAEEFGATTEWNGDEGWIVITK